MRALAPAGDLLQRLGPPPPCGQPPQQPPQARSHQARPHVLGLHPAWGPGCAPLQQLPPAPAARAGVTIAAPHTQPGRRGLPELRAAPCQAHHCPQQLEVAARPCVRHGQPTRLPERSGRGPQPKSESQGPTGQTTLPTRRRPPSRTRSRSLLVLEPLSAPSPAMRLRPNHRCRLPRKGEW